MSDGSAYCTALGIAHSPLHDALLPRREVPVNAMGRTMSVFTQTQENAAEVRKEWSPSAVMDIQINHLCRTLYFLVIKVGDPVIAKAIGGDPSVRSRCST